MNTGKTMKQALKESSRLLLGIVFKTGTLQLDKTVFDINFENMIEKNNEQIGQIKKDEQAYNEQVLKARGSACKKTYR